MTRSPLSLLALLTLIPLSVSAAPEVVHFQSGDAQLAGSFYPAPGAGKRTTILLLAGSGNENRETIPFHTLERLFNDAGYNVFAYDKRGVGQSGGKYDENASLDSMAGDALAAIRMLKGRPEVDGGHIGVWGISQGGSLAPLLATKSPDVHFIISVSGPGVSIAEQSIYFRASQMLEQGYSPGEVAEMQAFRRVLWAYYGTGLGAPAAQSAFDIAKTKSWYKKQQLPPALSRPDQLDPGLRAFMQEAAAYDPLAIVSSLKVPALFIFGARDSIVPVDTSLQNLIQAAGRSGNKSATFLLFPNAGHGLEVVTTPRECHECAEKEMERTQRWNAAPGLFDQMLSWLRSIQ